MHRQPKYFVTCFGEAHADEHPIDGGCYPHHSRWVERLDIQERDVMLLYCAAGYRGHHMEAPGIGIVLRTEATEAEDIIYYRYLPFDSPIDREAIVGCLDEQEKRKFIACRFIPNWMIEVKAPTLLQKVLRGRTINWP